MPGQKTRTAVVLCNLGGPDSPEAVEPFLFSLFDDLFELLNALGIGRMPKPLRKLLAWYIARRRRTVAQEIYAHLGGGSPILTNTARQAEALETKLGAEYRCFIAMRHWHPMTPETVAAVKQWAPDKIVLLPLYPQFSTTSTGSSLVEWRRQAAQSGLDTPSVEICCWPEQPGFMAAVAAGIRLRLPMNGDGPQPRLLFSAHGLPEKIVAAGDPYQWQVERSVAAIMAVLGDAAPEHVLCYQSRVGSMVWLGPSTPEEIERAGRDRVPVMVVPVAFVSEHSETLVELDIEYAKLAEISGVPEYIRLPTVDVDAAFIDGLAQLVTQAGRSPAGGCVSGGGDRICPAKFDKCPHKGEKAA